MKSQPNICICVSSKGLKENSWAAAFVKSFQETAVAFLGTTPNIIISEGTTTDIEKADAILIVLDQEPEVSEFTAWSEKLVKTMEQKKISSTGIILAAKAIPKVLKDISKKARLYNFSDIDPTTRQLRVYKITGTPVENTLFWSSLLDVLYELSEKTDSGNATQKRPKASVYLAPAPAGMIAARNRIARELRQRNITIFPDNEANNPSANIEESLLKCDIAIHLMGYHYGELVSGTSISATEQHLTYTSDFCIKNTNTLKTRNIDAYRIVCLPMQTEKADEQQLQLFQSLRFDPASKYTEIVQLPVEDIKILILERLNQKHKALAKLSKQSVYLIDEGKTTSVVAKVLNTVHTHSFTSNSLRYDTIDKSPTDKHRQYLSTSEIIIIVDDNAPDQWILSKIKDVVKAPGIGRNAPFKAKLIVSGASQRLIRIAEHNGFKLLDINDSLDDHLSQQLEKLM